MRGLWLWLGSGFCFVSTACVRLRHLCLCRYMKGWITAVPNGSLVLLDLMAEESPLWKRTQSYYGAPFIWCSE